MTRLEKKFFKLKNELAELENFAATKLAIFESQKKDILRIHKKYGVKELNTDNKFVDKMLTCDKLILRIYIPVSLIGLSFKQCENLQKKLREAGVPMPIGAVSRGKIELCYYD